ncbi:13689_t:CDS:2 [Funneliformis mosseae]|uniref:13689_t:CDS:1 n=1 Tax=Funneliformis mosseae TaxID=27381 RepID=A0A9N9GG33_FUNMO|nr:13689_t:CDS:2 [Funneliformis mosseae]
MSIISDAEKQQYFQVFSSLGPINGYLSDGQLDFDEFSVTYRLVNDLLAQIYPDVPLSLPPHLIPPSKAHLFGGGGTGFHGGSTLGISPRMIPQTISSIPQSISPIPLSINQISQSNSPLLSNMMPSYSQSQQLPQVPPPPPSLYHQSSSSSYGGFPTAPLSDDFDWNQVDVNFEQQLGKDQCLVFLHILNQRSKGKRIPDSLPSALKTSLVRGKLNYNYNETLDPSWKSKTSEGTSISTRSSYGQSHSGGKWEEEQLEKELAKLNENLKKAEDAALNSYTSALQISSGGGQTSEFKQLYEYKQKQLAELNEKEHLNRTLEEYIRKERLSVRELQDNIQSLKLHVKTLENTLETNQSEYRRLQQDVNLGR